MPLPIAPIRPRIGPLFDPTQFAALPSIMDDSPLFAAMRSRPAPARRSGFRGTLAELFTGPADPTLTPEQNAAAERQALMQGGLATILAAQQTDSPMAALAAGLLGGQTAGGRARASSVEGQQKTEFAKLLSETPRERWAELLMPLLAEGYYEPAKILIDALKATASDAVLKEVRVGDVVLLVDPHSGETVKSFELPESVKLESKDLGNRIVWYPENKPDEIIHTAYKQPMPGDGGARLNAPQEFTDPETGRRFLGAFDPSSGRIVPVEGAAPGPKAGDMRGQVLTGMLPAQLDVLERASAPGRIEHFLSRKGIRELTSPEMQELQLAGDAVASIYTFLISGVTARTDEVERARTLFVPMPGDKPATIDKKRANVRRFKELLRQNPNIQPGQLDDFAGFGAVHGDGSAGGAPDILSLIEQIAGAGQ